jgi:uncharacterized DUF497 family protein
LTPEPTFEWDEAKARANVYKHGISFFEALTVFSDPLARVFDDEDHSIDEERELIVGYSAQGNLLVVCFTIRGNEVIRIFSARKATREERRRHEEDDR